MSNSSSSWWARKLGTEPQRPAPTPQYGQPASYPQTPVYGGPPPLQPSTQHVQVTKDNIVAMTGMWKGGQGTKTETSRCPNCGGTDFFSRSNVNGSRIINSNSGTTASAAPHCFDCGYNGMYTQAGGQ